MNFGNGLQPYSPPYIITNWIGRIYAFGAVVFTLRDFTPSLLMAGIFGKIFMELLNYILKFKIFLACVVDIHIFTFYDTKTNLLSLNI